MAFHLLLLQAFMVWKFPSKTQVSQPGMPWSEELTNEKLNQVTKRLCRSTYQRDYLGIPQGNTPFILFTRLTVYAFRNGNTFFLLTSVTICASYYFHKVIHLYIYLPASISFYSIR